MMPTHRVARSSSAEIELRVLSQTRRFTTLAVVEARRGRDPLRTEVVRNNELDSYFCRACKIADACRHITAGRRFMTRAHLEVV